MNPINCTHLQLGIFSSTLNKLVHKTSKECSSIKMTVAIQLPQASDGGLYSLSKYMNNTRNELFDKPIAHNS